MNIFSNLKRLEVAEVFGVNEKTVLRWTKKGMPRNPDKSFDLKKCITWRFDSITATNGPGDSEESQRALTEYRKERTKIARIERRKLEGDLIDAAEVRREAFECAAAVKSKVTSWPSRVASLMAAESDLHKCGQILIKETRQLLEEISGSCP